MKETVKLVVIFSLLCCEAMFSSIAFSQQQGDSRDAEIRSLLKLSQETRVAPLYCEPPSSQTITSSSTDNTQYYTVKSGDYLSRIAENYGFPAVAYRAIIFYHNQHQQQIPGRRLEPIRNDNLIMPGWRLYIPSADQVREYMNQGSRYEPTRQNIGTLVSCGGINYNENNVLLSIVTWLGKEELDSYELS